MCVCILYFVIVCDASFIPSLPSSVCWKALFTYLSHNPTCRIEQILLSGNTYVYMCMSVCLLVFVYALVLCVMFLASYLKQMSFAVVLSFVGGFQSTGFGSYQ